MPKFKDFLASIGLAPKTLDQAKATIDSAKPVLDSVAALFASAGLDLDAMLSAGPDSLKAHLNSLSAKDADLATAQAKVAELTTSLSAKDLELTTGAANLVSANARIAAMNQAIGFDPAAKDAAGKPMEFKAAFEAHVAAASALLLAKDGRPPVAQISPSKADALSMTIKAFFALTPKEQLAFVNAGGKLSE